MRVLLVDDHASFRQPLAFMLDREPDFAVVGQAGTLAEARSQMSGVDIAVVDLDLPDGNGLELVRELHLRHAQAMALILTASLDRSAYARAVEAGAAGVLHKATPISDLIAALRRLSAGEQLLSSRDLIELMRVAGERRAQEREAQTALGRLTQREREVLQALAAGLNDKEIGQRLRISVETVRTHMVNILGKLGVESRLQAVLFALRHGLVQLED